MDGYFYNSCRKTVARHRAVQLTNGGGIGSANRPSLRITGPADSGRPCKTVRMGNPFAETWPHAAPCSTLGQRELSLGRFRRAFGMHLHCGGHALHQPYAAGPSPLVIRFVIAPIGACPRPAIPKPGI